MQSLSLYSLALIPPLYSPLCDVRAETLQVTLTLFHLISLESAKRHERMTRKFFPIFSLFLFCPFLFLSRVTQVFKQFGRAAAADSGKQFFQRVCTRVAVPSETPAPSAGISRSVWVPGPGGPSSKLSNTSSS